MSEENGKDKGRKSKIYRNKERETRNYFFVIDR